MPHVTSLDDETSDNIDFTDFVKIHNNQLHSAGIPEYYWPTLFRKLSREMNQYLAPPQPKLCLRRYPPLTNFFRTTSYRDKPKLQRDLEGEDIFDAGDYFKIYMVENEDGGNGWKVTATTDIRRNDPEQIYLIDHAWTYRIADCRNQLESHPQLLDRMASLMGIGTEGRDKEEVIEGVMQEMWRYNQTYSIGNFAHGSDEAMPIWYIMDEFGSRIQHSDTPTFKTAPFFYSPAQVAFTLLWPLENVDEDDEVTRDYIPRIRDPNLRKCRLLPWKPCDMKNVNYEQVEPDPSFFKSFLKLEEHADPSEYHGLPKDRNLKVYLSYPPFSKFLTDPRFELVSSESEADIIWVSHHWKDFKELKNRCINQFPFERVVTVKDLLAIVSRRAGDGKKDPATLEGTPKWLPVTYNLETELEKFISYFQHRQEKGLDNHWICKPWNLARGLDMHITSDLNYITRLPDTGPKIASKYVEDPVLFFREEIGNVKFDIRYIVLLAGVKPLKLYAYKVFWLRFANRAYSLDHFDEYEKHFTVMNYVEEGKKLKQVHYDDFIPMFESQYPAFKWSDVEEDIFQMFRELFTAASDLPGPQGISPSPQSRAMYAIDLLLQWSQNDKGERYMQPVICEVNFSPDCDRACKYHPHFVNDVFSTLFLEDFEGRHVQLL